MAMFGRRTRRTSRRALRKAHTRTLVAQAKAEKQFQSKTTRQADKLATKGQLKAGKVEQNRKRKDVASRTRSYLAVAKILTPVLAPFAYRAATAVRGQIDLNRARRIGVTVEQLGEFTGHGAALSARIAGLEPALAQMSPTHLAPADVEFRLSTTRRLAELSAAVNAAERMPTPRRKSAHRSIAANLDRIDAEVLRKLGVR